MPAVTVKTFAEPASHLYTGGPNSPNTITGSERVGDADNRDSGSFRYGSGRKIRTGYPCSSEADGGGEQHDAPAALAGLSASDDLRNDAVETLPRHGSSGLPVPRFGPEATLSVLLPAQALAVPGLPEGKRKTPKGFRVPGDRAAATVTTQTVTNGTVLRDGNTRALVVQSTGRTISKDSGDGTALIAEALLDAGVLRESDWQGGIERSVRRGLARWVNDDMGGSSLRFLGPLELVYTDDAAAYSTGARMHRWSEHFRGRPDRPTGFFALRWQDDPRPVYVRRAVQQLNQAWPGYGPGLIELIQSACVSGINGNTFLWGQAFIQSGEAMRSKMLVDFEDYDQDPFGVLDNMVDMGGEISLKDFHKQVPQAACKGGFNLEKAQRIAEAAPKKHPHLAPITTAALALWEACRACGLTFYTTNHFPLLSWQMYQMDVQSGRRVAINTPRLYRAPCFYTVWNENTRNDGAKTTCEEEEPDLMGRLTDDHTHACKQTMTYSDLTWLHGFQVNHSCPDPGGASKELATRERLIKKIAKQHPEHISWLDPNYVQKPMPDGGLIHAAQALRLVMGIVKALDNLLALLHQPSSLMEMSRAGQLGEDS